MKKLMVILLAMLLMTSGIALAEVTKFDKKNLEFGLEYNYADKDIQDVELLSVNIPDVLNGNLVLVNQKLHLNQELATVGYKLGDLLTPYAILGISQLNGNTRLNGDIATECWSAGATLLEIPYNKGGSAFTYGLGAKGNLLELPAQVILGYDVRMTTFKGDSNNNIVLLPGDCGFELGAKKEIKYLELNTLLSASREFKLTNKDGSDRKYLQSITPMLGFKYSRVDINGKTTVNIEDATVASEQNVKGDLYSAVVGVSCKVTSNIDVKATGSFGGDKGFGVAATYRF
jgi:opacity protein-like surface antigen